MKVLEIGPGSGRNLKIFDDLKCETTGVELSSKMSEVAKKWSPNSKIIIGNILECDFEAESYDIIFVMAVIHNFPLEDQILLLNKIFNWLKDDGYLILGTTINEAESEGVLTKEDYIGEVKRYRYSHTKESFENLAKNNNFEIVKSYITKEEQRNKKWYNLVCMKNKY
jgi:SAM-dependent methyltransferase